MKLGQEFDLSKNVLSLERIRVLREKLVCGITLDTTIFVRT